MYEQTVTYHKTSVCISLLPIEREFKNILVVGCGNGIEAYCLSDTFPNASVTGIDLSVENPITEGNVSIRKLDVTQLPFSEESFDLIYSYHVLEHVPDYNKALAEINRVLTKDGLLIIGTPNRDRLIGCLSANCSFIDKVKWNIVDWTYKLKGQFKNEFGAHAGYKNIELKEILNSHFTEVVEITKKYYQLLYKSKLPFLNTIYKIKMEKYLLPAIYFFGTKNSGSINQ